MSAAQESHEISPGVRIAASGPSIPAPDDPMPGSIARAVERVKQQYLLDERDLGLALNEAFRNGMEAERVKIDTHWVWVRIPGVPDTRPDASGEHACWPTTPSGEIDGRPVFEVAGDPNAVAVGRFKASLRKFLGL